MGERIREKTRVRAEQIERMRDSGMKARDIAHALGVTIAIVQNSYAVVRKIRAEKVGGVIPDMGDGMPWCGDFIKKPKYEDMP